MARIHRHVQWVNVLQSVASLTPLPSISPLYRRLTTNRTGKFGWVPGVVIARDRPHNFHFFRCRRALCVQHPTAVVLPLNHHRRDHWRSAAVDVTADADADAAPNVAADAAADTSADAAAAAVRPCCRYSCFCRARLAPFPAVFFVFVSIFVLQYYFLKFGWKQLSPFIFVLVSTLIQFRTSVFDFVSFFLLPN